MRILTLAVTVAIGAFCLTGCGGEPTTDAKSSSRPSTSAKAQDNSMLTPGELLEATGRALVAGEPYRAKVIGEGPHGDTNVEIVIGPHTYLQGTVDGARIEAIGASSMYVKFATIPGFTQEQATAFRRALHGRWLRAHWSDDEVGPLHHLTLDVRRSLIYGSNPVLGEDKLIDGIETVSYAFADGTAVHVTREGTPLPVLIETKTMTVRYSDFDKATSPEIPPIEQTISFEDALAGRF